MAATDPVETGLPPELDPLAIGAGGHAQRLARGAVLQQGAQVLRLVGGFFVITVLVDIGAHLLVRGTKARV